MQVPLGPVHALLAKGRLTVGEILASEVQFLPSSRKHIAYKVLRRAPKPSLFLKILIPDVESQLSEEILFYNVVGSVPAFADLRQHLVAGSGSSDSRILETELVDGETVRDVYHDIREVPPSLSLALGTALSAFHRSSSELAAAVARRRPPIEAMPWTIGIGTNFDLESRNARPTDRKIVRIVRSEPQFVAALESLQKLWKIEGLIHGDMKWDNCLASREGTNWHVRLIDWEGYYLGDTAWDCAGIVADYWIHWINSIPASALALEHGFSATARFDLAQLLASLRAFWEGYFEGRPMSAESRAEHLHRAIALSSARMVHHVFEVGRTKFDFEITKSMIVALQFASNLLLDVPGMIRELGLPCG